MAERVTAGYNLFFTDTTLKAVGIIQEFDITYEGDTEDISGLADVENGIVRRKGEPVDVGATLTCSGKVDTSATGYSAFKAAMEARTAESELSFLKDSVGMAYTGHAESYNETASRSEAVWNFSLTFYVNSEDPVLS